MGSSDSLPAHILEYVWATWFKETPFSPYIRYNVRTYTGQSRHGVVGVQNYRVNGHVSVSEIDCEDSFD